MKRLITGCVVALAFGVTATAQDSTVTSRTKVSGDDARAVTMRGCLQQTAGNTGYLLLGAVTASGEDLKTKSKVKTDVDSDDTKVKSKSATKVDKDDRVGTTGALTTYAVLPRDGVDLAAHAGEEVELTAVMIDPRDGNDKEADVKVKETTKIDPDDAPDTKVQNKTKLEVTRGATARLMAMSVKSLGRSCSIR
jgi:hypothetical protein